MKNLSQMRKVRWNFLHPNSAHFARQSIERDFPLFVSNPLVSVNRDVSRKKQTSFENTTSEFTSVVGDDS